MEFSLIHAGLAAGAGLAAMPVILHLFMRQTPKHVIFPALRLIRERQKRSKKKLRVKNWLLLLARMAILALMALALARPRLHSDIPLGDESVPTALGLVFDTSLSMQYKEPGKDKSRLDDAKERAREILKKVPESSQIFVVDSFDPVTTGLAPSAALKQIDGLVTHAANRPLNLAMGQAYRAISEADQPRREVYVLTDLSRTSWHAAEPAEGLDLVKKGDAKPGSKISTYVLRLTSEDLTNVAVVSADPSSPVAAQGESINIKARLRSTGPATKRVVEFYLDNQKKDQKTVDIPASGQVEVSFPTPQRLSKEGEIHRGWIQLSGTPDPLEFDDKRFFTFRVRPAFKVLLVSDDLVRDTFEVAAALDFDSSPTATKTNQVEKVATSQFATKFRNGLKGYSCVFLLNAAKPDVDTWGLLNAFVHEGGGLVVGLGHHCVPDNYNGAIASQLLPAQLLTTTPLRTETTFGNLSDQTHPLFQLYGKDLATQLAQVPIYQYWKVKIPEGTKQTRTLLNFADGSPALLERSFPGQKGGHTLLWSTPLSRRVDRKNEAGGWNEFPNPFYGFSFLVLMLQSVPYMAGITSEQLNFEAGDTVQLATEAGIRYKNFILSKDGEKTVEQQGPAGSSEHLEIVAPQSVGQYTVRAIAQDGQETQLGFTVNAPNHESDLAPLEANDLTTIFGKDGYMLAENRNDLEKFTRIAHVGYEIFPCLMMIILLIVTAENFLANTFYKEAPKPKVAGAPA